MRKARMQVEGSALDADVPRQKKSQSAALEGGQIAR